MHAEARVSLCESGRSPDASCSGVLAVASWRWDSSRLFSSSSSSPSSSPRLPGCSHLTTRSRNSREESPDDSQRSRNTHHRMKEAL